jgi:hypothetical protein
MPGKTSKPEKDYRTLGGVFKNFIKHKRSSTSIRNANDAASNDKSTPGTNLKRLDRAHTTKPTPTNGYSQSDDLSVQQPQASDKRPWFGGEDAGGQTAAVTGAAHIAEPANDLSDDIADTIALNIIGLPETGETNYLPDEERKSLVTTKSIRRTLGTVSDNFVQWIHEKASKTFVITVLAIHEQGKRLEAMKGFYFHNFEDAYLPVNKFTGSCKYNVQASKRTACGDQCDQRETRKCHGVHGGHLDCFHHRVWTTNALQTFCEKQWKLLLQKFLAEEFEYPDIEDDRILPFLPSTAAGAKEGTGNFAVVQPARMLRGHQNTLKDVRCFLT